MDIFIKSFFDNPAGKGSSFLNLPAIKRDYDSRYVKIQKNIDIHSVILRTKEIFLIVKIPSSVEGISYDVVLSFTPGETDASNIYSMKMKVFSNSPSFVYTYLYSYNRNKIFDKRFRGKLPHAAFDKSITKNPYNIISYDFSVYAAMKHVLTHGYTNLSDITTISIGSNFTNVFHAVNHFDKIQKARQSKQDELRELKREEKEARKNKIQSFGKRVPNENEQSSPGVRSAPTVKSVKKVSIISKIKKVHKIKKL